MEIEVGVPVDVLDKNSPAKTTLMGFGFGSHLVVTVGCCAVDELDDDFGVALRVVVQHVGTGYGVLKVDEDDVPDPIGLAFKFADQARDWPEWDTTDATDKRHWAPVGERVEALAVSLGMKPWGKSS